VVPEQLARLNIGSAHGTESMNENAQVEDQDHEKQQPGAFGSAKPSYSEFGDDQTPVPDVDVDGANPFKNSPSAAELEKPDAPPRDRYNEASDDDFDKASK